MEDDLQIIYVGDDAHQAQLIVNLLEEHGIEAHLTRGALDAADAAGLGGMAFELEKSKVWVADEDARRARDVLHHAQQAKQDGLSSPELSRLEDEADRHSSGWPQCPSCGRRRHTSCPVCETAGTEFPAAFFPDDEPALPAGDEADGEPPAARTSPPRLVVCTTCDEPFEPEFPGRCEWCGYRFADGWEPPPFVAPQPGEFNLRVVATVAGLVVTVLALVGFFATVLSEPKADEPGAAERPSPAKGNAQ